MDSNGTRFHLLLGRADWARCLPDERVAAQAAGALPPGTGWDPWRGELTLEPRAFRFPTPAGARLDPDARRGAAADRFGNWYRIADDRRSIRVTSAGTGTESAFWPASRPAAPQRRDGSFGPVATPPALPAALAGLAVTPGHLLVAGTLDPAGLLAFDLHAGGGPWHLPWPAGLGLEPFDLAAAPDGGLLLLDRVHRRYWVLDAALRVRAGAAEVVLDPGARETFQPVEGPERTSPARTFPDGISLDDAGAVAEPDPIAIEALPGGSALILDRGGRTSAIRRYRDGAPVGEPVPVELRAVLEDGEELSLDVRAHDFAFLPAERSGAQDPLGTLLFASSGGDQCHAFHLCEDAAGQLALLPRFEYWPMRLYDGTALAPRDGETFYDSAGRFLPLVSQSRPRYVEAATFRTFPLDGKEPGCTWHRLFLDGCLPPGASVAVESRAADALEDLPGVPFRREPRPLRRASGSELPFADDARGAGRETFELLLQAARGRFLELRLTLAGDRASSPRVRALRAYYPRFSYLERYLPAAYREDPESASFLDRFLANLEGLLTPVEDRVASAHVLLDPRVAPRQALDWLAGFFGVALDPAWDERTRRLFVRHADVFFRHRGTERGLRMALRLATDPCVDERLFAEDPGPLGAGIRIVDRASAAPPAAAPGAGAGIVASAPGERWSPSHGGEALSRRYVEALAARGLDASAARFPLSPPDDLAIATVWREVARLVLGFVPDTSLADEGAWHAFLARRHRTVAALSARYGMTVGAFEDVSLPVRLPPDGAPLADWYDFAAVVVPRLRAAHRFTVFLPAAPGQDAASLAELSGRARRVVEFEKPAHAAFDVRFYWAMFRVGEARVGVDTTVDLGSLHPDLLRPARLGAAFVAESYLAPEPPQDALDRRLLGRDPLEPPPSARRDP